MKISSTVGHGKISNVGVTGKYLLLGHGKIPTNGPGENICHYWSGEDIYTDFGQWIISTLQYCTLVSQGTISTSDSQWIISTCVSHVSINVRQGN